MKIVYIVLVVLYIILAVIYSYYIAVKEENLWRGAYTLVLCIGIPVAGFLFLWLTQMWEEQHKEKDYREFERGDEYQEDNLKLLQPVDVEKEINYVPMAEALSVTSFEYRRKMIMDLLNEDDTLEYLEVLRDALSNEDMETSHYASTVIMELQRKVQEELIEKEVEFEQHQMEEEPALRWEEFLFRVIESDLYDEQNLRRYYVKYRKVSDQLLKMEKPKEEVYNNRVQILLKEKNYTEGKIYTEQYLLAYPESEDAVLCMLKILIQEKNAEELETFIAGLSKRPVVLTQKTLKYIRMFRKA